MKSKKLEVLLSVYKELSKEFSKFNDADLNKIVESWSISIKRITMTPIVKIKKNYNDTHRKKTEKELRRHPS